MLQPIGDSVVGIGGTRLRDNTMAIMTNCCGRGSLKSGCIAIGAALFVFCFVFDLITIGIVAGFPTIDTKFLDANLMR